MWRILARVPEDPQLELPFFIAEFPNAPKGG
jgi:hypothetical protein